MGPRRERRWLEGDPPLDSAEWRWWRWLPYVFLCNSGGTAVWIRWQTPVDFDEGEG